jgi:hypothetical protein
MVGGVSKAIGKIHFVVGSLYSIREFGVEPTAKSGNVGNVRKSHGSMRMLRSQRVGFYNRAKSAM